MFNFIIFLLATWRITSLITFEKGPKDIFLRFRERIGAEFVLNKKGEEVLKTKNIITELIVCPWCTSIWVGLLWALGWEWNVNIATFIALPFAFSAGAILIDNLVHRG